MKSSLLFAAALTLAGGAATADESLAPEARKLDLGAFAGLLSLSPNHNLQNPEAVHVGFKAVTPELGLRATYLWNKHVGAEAEGTFGVTRTLDPDQKWGTTAALRAHAILPCPWTKHGLQPFGVVGAGFMGAYTSAMGNDIDPSLHAGIGTWWKVNEQWKLRGDLRGNWTQKVEADQGSMSFHPEALISVSYTKPAPAPVVEAPPPAPVAPPPPPPPAPVVEIPKVLPKPAPVIEKPIAKAVVVALPEAVKQFSGVIAGIEFDTASATIRKASYDLLDKAATTLKEFPELRVKITGHTDDRGDADKNLSLSKRRAEAVKSYLAGKGVAADRLDADGLGSSKPVADNGTEDGRQKNRRIEFEITSK